jgi:hypothetical protein
MLVPKLVPSTHGDQFVLLHRDGRNLNFEDL